MLAQIKVRAVRSMRALKVRMGATSVHVACGSERAYPQAEK
jgi:hypothetical protein